MNAARLLPLLPVLLLSGAASAQFEDQKVLPDLSVDSARFGRTMDADNGMVLLGAPGTVFNQGRAYVYERSGSTWSQIARFEEDTQTGSNGFGLSVALSGNFAAVGAPTEALAGGGTGMVYIFERQAGVWGEVAQIFPSDGQPQDEFGSSVAIDGSTLIVGARMAGSSLREGAAYVFERIAGNWVETQKLVASNGAAIDRFGTVVDLDGNTAVVAAPFEDNAGGTNAGRVYVFENNGTSWVEVQRIRASGGVPNSFLGTDLSLEGDTLMAGTQVGEVLVLDRVQGLFSEVDLLVPAPGALNDAFGGRVDLSGNYALVGSHNTLIEFAWVGSALLFERQAAGWILLNDVVASDREGGDRFGRDVALDGSVMLIGADGDDDLTFDSGAFYSFSPSELDTDLYCFCDAQVAPCGNSVAFAGCGAGATARGARIEAVGSTSVTADDLILLGSNMLPNAPCLFFMGAAQTQLTFGNGLRCVDGGGSGLFRFPMQSSGPEGLLQLGPGVVAHSLANFNAGGQIQPGDRWNFQMWYRDNQGLCGANFITSNALSAVFSN